jgi:excinuclease UvrABC nuclease subunit
MNLNWTEYKSFPDPRKQEYLFAPFGAGVYELRNRIENELVYIGKGNNVAVRVSSLLPAPLGCGTRNNSLLREYIHHHLEEIEYRTYACANEEEALSIEIQLQQTHKYRFC